MSEFIDTFVKFSNFMSRRWGFNFDSLFCPEGRDFVNNDCPGGGGGVFLPPSSRVPWFVHGGMVLDETDSCIKGNLRSEKELSSNERA